MIATPYLGITLVSWDSLISDYSFVSLEKIHSDFLSEWQSCQESIFDKCERKIDEIKVRELLL